MTSGPKASEDDQLVELTADMMAQHEGQRAAAQRADLEQRERKRKLLVDAAARKVIDKGVSVGEAAVAMMRSKHPGAFRTADCEAIFARLAELGHELDEKSLKLRAQLAERAATLSTSAPSTRNR